MAPGALWLSHVYDVPEECLESLSKGRGPENSPIRHTLRIFGLNFKHLAYQRMVLCSLLGCRPSNINHLIFFASLQLHFPYFVRPQASFSQGHQGEYVVSLLIFRQASNIFNYRRQCNPSCRLRSRRQIDHWRPVCTMAPRGVLLYDVSVNFAA